jgi:hypothetical protein
MPPEYCAKAAVVESRQRINRVFFIAGSPDCRDSEGPFADKAANVRFSELT